MRKRILSGLLAFMMVLALLPGEAWAYKTHPANAGRDQRVSLGAFATAAIGGDGGLYLCGENFGSTLERYVPEETFRSVAAGRASGMAITTGGSLYVWGDRNLIGTGDSSSDGTVPALVSMPGGERVSCVALNDDQRATYAAITESGALYTWGSNSGSLTGVPQTSNTQNIRTPQRLMADKAFRSVSFGGDHAAAVTTDGQLYTWGLNKHGQLGNGETTTGYTATSPTLISVPGAAFASVILVEERSAAITTNGELYMWGNNSGGAAGIGTTGDVLAPAKVLDDVREVEMSTYNSVALKNDGTVWVWGSYNSLLGGVKYTSSNITEPEQLTVMSGYSRQPLRDVVAIATGGQSAAAVTANGTLYGWGSIPGTGKEGSSNSNYMPAVVMEGTRFTQAFGGHQHMAALSDNGALYIWGTNSFGAVGNGKTEKELTPYMALYKEGSLQPDVCAHQWGEYRVLHEADCTSPGSRGRNCALCGAVQTEVFAAPLGHQWGEFVETVPAENCLQEGSRTRTCARCGKAEEEHFKGPHKELGGEDCSLPTICTVCLQVLRPGGEHILTYAASGAVITQTCTTGCGHTASVTLLATDETDYKGGTVENADPVWDENWQGEKPPLTYQNNNKAGTATASLTIGGVTASVNFQIRPKWIDLKKYLINDGSSPNSGSTMGGRRYFSEAIRKQNREDVVYSLTAVSLENAPAKTAEAIRQQIGNLLYNATYKPLEMFENPGKDNKDYKKIIATWPIKNRNNCSAGPITDSGLGVSITLPGEYGGCYSYTLFGEKYVYGTAGKKKIVGTGSKQNGLTTASVISAFHAYLDPGESIRYESVKVAHALLFLGESIDGQGFYFISYDGGSNSSTDLIRLGYFSYENFTRLLNLNSYTLILWNANNGSYYSMDQNVYGVGIKPEAKTGHVVIDCPVEAVISLNGETLDSRLLADGESQYTTFGSMTVSGPVGGDRTVKIDFNEGYIDSELLDLKIFGTANGTMDVTVSYVYTDPLIGEGVELTDTRAFKNIPITADTTVYATSLSVATTTSFFVDDNTADGIKIWQANNGETATEFCSYAQMYDPIGDDEITSDPPILPDTPIYTPTNPITPVVPVTPNPGAPVSTAPEAPSDAPSGTPTVPEAPETPEAAPLPFTDVSAGDWFHDAVRYVYDEGIMNGTSATQFSPTATTTRGMIVTILHRLEGEPAEDASSFTDVPASQWYADAVRWASANGIAGGYGDGRFGPDDTVTREQLAAILYRYTAFKGGDTSARADTSIYADSSDISGYALDAMSWAAAAGIVNGYGDGRLAPQASATRAEIAQMLMNYLKK